MIDLRKIDIWYSNNFAKVSKEQKKLKNIFSKAQEKNNRKKIEKFIETESRTISSRLKTYHKTNYNSFFWQKIIQKWIFYVSDNVFINYQLFQKIFNKKKQYKIYKFSNQISGNVSHLKTDTEAFHLFLASEYIKFKKYNYKEKVFKINPLQKKRNKFLLKKKKKIFYKKIYSFISKLVYKFFPARFLLLDLGLPFKDIFFLNLKLKQFPFFFDFEYTKEEKDLDYETRKSIFRYTGDDDFKIFFYLILKKLFPTDYLENFEEIKNKCDKEFAKKPKLILTQNIYSPEDINIFFALMQEEKTKLLILQHGGLYGTHYYPTGEKTEFLIADKFFSWGWKRNKKTYPFFSLPFCSYIDNLKINKFEKDKILLCAIVNTSFLNTSSDISRNNFDKLKVLKTLEYFTKAIKTKYLKKLTIRYLKRSESSGMIFEKKGFPKLVKFDEGKDKLFNIINDYKLVIHEGITTSGLETMTYNLPTLFLIDEKIELFHNSFKPIFNEMVKNEIIHLNYKSLAKFINKNYNNIEDWWKSKKVEKASQLFKNTYARTDRLYKVKITKMLLNSNRLSFNKKNIL